MRSIICASPGHLEYRDDAMPSPDKGETLLKIHRIGICGTDLHAFEGTQPYFTYPRILGHELAAEIADTDHPDFTPGEAVTIIPYFNCGHCIACKNDKPNCCASMQVCGVHVDGGMREYLKVPSYSLVKSEGLGFDELALIEPLSIGAHGLRRAQLHAGEYVLIIGAGPIGLGAMELAHMAGAHVIAMDVNPHRLKFCTDQLNVTHVINPMLDDVKDKLMAITSGNMPEVVIDATGNLQAINSAFQWISHGGRYVLIGLQKGDIVINHPEFHKREATLMSSRNATRIDFEKVITGLKEGNINPSNYITHRVHFDEAVNNFPSLTKPDSGVIKAMISL
jgi:2-desacetyl-2-hydroxyethyl bacteriochlorophyllide A dehydrogenase